MLQIEDLYLRIKIAENSLLYQKKKGDQIKFRIQLATKIKTISLVQKTCQREEKQNIIL